MTKRRFRRQPGMAVGAADVPFRADNSRHASGCVVAPCKARRGLHWKVSTEARFPALEAESHDLPAQWTGWVWGNRGRSKSSDWPVGH
jgi:hypothetical protein